jgi:hypothetical protein
MESQPDDRQQPVNEAEATPRLPYAGPGTNVRPLSQWHFWIPLAILIASIAAWFWVINRQTPPPPPPPAMPQLELTDRTASSDAWEARVRFYHDLVVPRLHQHYLDNREAQNRTLQRIDDVFARYARGIGPFADDVISYGTRFRVLWRMPGDWWYEDGRVHQLIQAKLEKHLFTDEQLSRDLAQVLAAFRSDIDANRNRLLSDVQAAVHEGDLPDVVLPDLSAFARQVHLDVQEFASGRARDSVYHGLATLIASEVAAVAATQVSLFVIRSVAIGAAGSAAGAGGATAGGAAAGGGAGSVLGGPVGTVIGFAVGIVIGIGVDWWMSESFKDRLQHDLRDYLNDVRNTIVNGTEDAQGLAEALGEVLEDLHQAESSAISRLLIVERNE